MSDEKNLAIIFCPPLSKYPEPPKDISKSELIDCPDCKNPMWYSEMKRAWRKISEDAGREIIFCCHDCFLEKIKNDPTIMREAIALKL